MATESAADYTKTANLATVATSGSYNDLLNKASIDIQLLGIGANGHIGFNEPHTPFDQETWVVKLT